MKKILCFIIAAILIICVGCSSRTIADDPIESINPIVEPTPEPTPEPAVFKVAVVTDTEAEFFKNGILSVIDNTEVITTTVGIDAGAKEAAENEATVVIAHVSEEGTDLKALEELAANDVTVLLFDSASNSMPAGVKVFGYDTAGAQASIFNTLMTLPNHDTPVRLFGMFTSSTTNAATSYSSGTAEGKIFNKGVYYEDELEATAEEWIADMLKDYYPGMLDAVYTENERFAETVLSVLNSLERTDIEVVTLYNDIPSELMQNNPYIYTAQVCPNTYYIGAYLANEALKIKNDEDIEVVVFTPDVIYGSYLNDGLITQNMSELFPM